MFNGWTGKPSGSVVIGDTAEAAVEAVQTEIDTAQQAFDTEKASVETLVAELSAAQLFALNRSLNNAVASELLLKIGAEQLAAVIEGDFNKQQINSLTKAFEAEAKFLRLAEETGNAKFISKAETEKSKFLSRIERFGGDRGGLKTASGPNVVERRQKSKGPAILTTLGVTSVNVSAVTNGFVQPDKPVAAKRQSATKDRAQGSAAASSGKNAGGVASVVSVGAGGGNPGNGNGSAGGSSGGGNPGNGNGGSSSSSSSSAAGVGGGPGNSNAGGNGNGNAGGNGKGRGKGNSG